MTVSRRLVLKGMALGSLAGMTLAGSLPALARTAAAASSGALNQPIRTLVSLGAADSAFVQGARAAIGLPLQVQEAGLGLGHLLKFERELARGQPMRVIGLLDDASAVLLVDLARSAGARIHWLGQHTASAGITRHQLLNSSLADSCVQQLAQQLQGCGAPFTLEHNGAAPLTGTAGDNHSPQQWTASVGYLLASLAAGHPAGAPPVFNERTLLTGSFVSFSIET